MRRVVLGILLALSASAATAAEKLLQGPPPAWVKPAAPLKAGPPAADGPPVSYLRLDRQLNFGVEGDSIYQESVSQIRTALGLSQAGTISLSWDPTRDTVTIHKLRILRDGHPIDVLAKQSFTIIRREANLAEIVDGRLTATLQPEDLRVGDVLEMAYTQTHLDPVLQGRTDFAVNLGGLRGVGTFSLRATWPSTERIAWRAGTALGAPKVSRRSGVTELSVELKDPPALKGPSGAPARYWPTRDLEFSEFASWAEVAAQLAPHFDRASTLGPDSPLKAEAAKIRALSDDPKVRAAAALKLVQDQVRYLGLILADGGYTPVDADKTWARRFGECKAKTVLLIALLRELGVEAEPALVNAYTGEGIDRQLPRMSAFNHVLVRSMISGKVYWLDGTRSGDGALDSLQVPNHRWALPIREQGSTLVELVEPPRTKPESETFLEVDASGGIEAPAPVKGEMIMRGDRALWPGLMVANMPVADRDRILKAMWTGHPGLEVKTVTASRDPETGVSRMIMTGVAKLRWLQAPNGARWLLVPQGALGWRAEFKREPDEDATAPFAVGYPTFVTNRFAIRLPHRGEGFSAPAEDVDMTIAGRAFLRRTKVEGALVTIETSVRALAPEFPAAEATAAAEALTQMANTRVVIQAPRIYHATPADVTAWLAETPKTANEHIERGAKLMQAGRSKEGVADFERAVVLDPKSSWAYANRGLARIHLGEFELAKVDLDQAAKLEPRNAQVQGGLAALAMRDGRYADAVAAYTRAADLMPNNVFALGGRAEAHLRMGASDNALSDYAELLKMDPKLYQAYLGRSRIHGSRGDWDRALSDLDEASKLAPGEPFIQTYRGAMLAKMSRRDEAEKAFAASIALKPTVEAYLTRASNRPKSDVKGRLSDLIAGEKLDPDNPDIPMVRARIHIDGGEPTKAIPILTRAMQAEEKSPGLLATRAEAYAKAGQTASAQKDFAEMRREAAGSADALNNLCWTQATLNLSLEAALEDCDAALKLSPKAPHIADSRGFVLLRLGRLKDAVAAYDESLSLRTQHAESLYGRGVAKKRLGLAADAEADLAAARARASTIDATFAEYGVAP